MKKSIKILTITLVAILVGFVLESIQAKALYSGADFTGALTANIVILLATISADKMEKAKKIKNSKKLLYVANAK